MLTRKMMSITSTAIAGIVDTKQESKQHISSSLFPAFFYGRLSLVQINFCFLKVILLEGENGLKSVWKQ